MRQLEFKIMVNTDNLPLLVGIHSLRHQLSFDPYLYFKICSLICHPLQLPNQITSSLTLVQELTSDSLLLTQPILFSFYLIINVVYTLIVFSN